MVEHPLGGHSLVELTTLNKALLRRQPKHLNHFVHQFVFFFFEFAWFDFTCFDFDLYVLSCSEVPRLLWRRRESMESLVLALGMSRAECRDFSTQHWKIFLSGTSRRWSHRHNVEKHASLEHRNVGKKTLSRKSRHWMFNSR